MLFSFFKKTPRSKPKSILEYYLPAGTQTDAGQTIIDEAKMTLEERREWRLEMVRMSVVEVFSSLEILGGMYRYRAMPIDERSHFFIVAVETTKHFVLSKYTATRKLADVEKKLKEHAALNYGVVIDSVYWKANETVDIFEEASRKKLPPARSKKTIEELTNSFADTMPMIYDDVVSEKYEPLSDDEATAFRAALAKGMRPPPVKINGKEYDTDLAPLGPQ
jgi:hypothetical protein